MRFIPEIIHIALARGCQLIVFVAERGQGLNHCIADVANFVKGLKALPKPADLAKVIEAYQSEMIERAGDEVKLSLKNTYMLHDWEMLLQSPLMQSGGARVPAKRD